MNAPLITPTDGPADPPSSAPRRGVLPGPVHRVSFEPDAGVHRVDLPGPALRITADAVLDWAFYADGPAAALPPHAGLAVSIDVRFEDGSRLSQDARVRDRYGFALTPGAQFEAAWSMPEQWNADSVALGPWAGRDGVIEVVVGAPGLAGAPAEAFLQARVREHRPAAPRPVERVDTRRGTHAGDRFSRGNTVPAVAVPHGFCFVIPVTDPDAERWPYRAFAHDETEGRPLAGLRFSHQPSPWMGDHGVLQLRPFLTAPTEAPHRVPREDETAHPHLYRARTGSGLVIEATATDHGGAFRLTGPSGGPVGCVLEQIVPGGAFDVEDGGFTGFVPEGDPGWGNAPRTFFAGRVSGGTAQADGPARGVVVGTGALEVRIGLSYLSLAQARHNLDAEAPAGRDFDALSAGAGDAWNRLLDRVTLPPLAPQDEPFLGLADAEDRARLASALYRLHLYPNAAHEAAGPGGAPAFADPMLPAAPHSATTTGSPVTAGRLFVNNGYWDTYRTAWPALALLDPGLSADLLDGVLQQARSGGWMARWSAPGYADCMVGTSSDQVFADAAAWGLPLAAARAFDTGWRNACEPAPDPRQGRKGIGAGRFVGHVDAATAEGMSWSLENAISDAALARLAGRLADADRAPNRYDAFARYFANRSLSYRTLFDADTGFFRGRSPAGAFTEPFDPRTWGGDNVETNAWGMSVAPVHDGAGLAALHGGPAGLGRHLDALFATPETAEEAFAGSYGAVIHEQREARAVRSGMCALSNQPAHHIPFMYRFSDRPWLAGEIAHGLARRLFAGAMIDQGFPGDEDNGEMSAWWLFAALGLYPLEPGAGELVIGSPLFDDITVRRGDGSSLRVRTTRTAPGAHVLASAFLAGRPLPDAAVPLAALTGDAVLELRYGTDPAAALRPRVPAARRYRPDRSGTATLSASPGVAVAGLVDDRGETTVTLPAGGWAQWDFARPTRLTDVAVTAAEPVALGSLEWRGLTEHGWRALHPGHAEDLFADRTTPFRLRETPPLRAMRVVAHWPVTLRQVELFDLS